MFRQPEGKGTQQFRLRDNRGSVAPILDNRSSSVLQAKWMNSIPCMQRKLPKKTGLTPSSGKAKVWLGNINDPKERPEGILCKDISVNKGSDKAGALKNISTEAGDVGTQATTNDWAIADAGNDKYNVQASTKMNPFQVPIKAAYGESQSGPEIKLFYHYGPYNHGYIVKVELKENESVETGTMTSRDQVGENEYSSKHDTKDDRIILDQTDGQEKSKKFDAYTKLAGEGARFQCVKRNIDMISNNTIICIPFATKGFAFSDFWKTWGTTFGKKFEIADEVVITEIQGKDELDVSFQVIKNNGKTMIHTETIKSKDISDNNKIELIPSENLNNQRFNQAKRNGVKNFLKDIFTEPELNCISDKIKEKDVAGLNEFENFLFTCRKKNGRGKLREIVEDSKKDEIHNQIMAKLWT